MLTEFADAMSKVRRRASAARYLEGILQDSSVTVLPPDMARFRRGLALYANRPNKEWSLTDCVSFEVMRELRLTDALTGDRHFEQAGFRALLSA